MRWRLILEEYGPELKNIKGENNVVADALSRLQMLPLKSESNPLYMVEHFGLEEDDLPTDAFPLSYKTLMIHQQADKPLMNTAKTHKGYAVAQFHGGGKTMALIVKDYTHQPHLPTHARNRLHQTLPGNETTTTRRDNQHKNPNQGTATTTTSRD